MPLLKEEYTKEEKINGVIYDMLPSPNYQHGIVDGNMFHYIEQMGYSYSFEVNHKYFYYHKTTQNIHQ